MTRFLTVKFSVAVTSICAALITSGSTQLVVLNDLQSNDINGRTCGENEFECLSGECIPSEFLCDGRADCSNWSDETEFECTKPELTCPNDTFRCNYGACVNGDAICNGVMDCIDKSDETLSKCPGMSAADLDESCRPEELQCQDGQCISSSSVCDGAFDCTDGSDETFVKCGSIPCSQFVFRCNYGACIHDDLRCNNVTNCADGSDEDPLLCGYPETGHPIVKMSIPTPSPTSTPTPTPTPTPRPRLRPKPRLALKPTPKPTTTTSVPDPSTSSSLLCLVPPQPNHGQWKLDKSLCGGLGGRNADCEIPADIMLRPGSPLIYTCDPGYKLKGISRVHCETWGNWSSLPDCVEIKCSPLNSESTRASCTTRMGDWISCDSAVPPETRASVTCRSGYRKDTTSITTQREAVQCNPNGKWVPDPIKCVPACGKANIHETPFVTNGAPARLADFPWHATLYMQKNAEVAAKKEFLCGATIIQKNLVLTAAHCIYDEIIRATVDPKKLFVMTGNIFRDYNSPLHNDQTVKKSPVKKVYRKCEYYGLTGNYASDIALLELEEPFQLSEILLPACLDVAGESEQILEAGAFGNVAGFGRTATGASSGILQTLRVPYVPYGVCKGSIDRPGNEIFIGNDKFCAGYNNGSAVCEGDSGGGLVFKKADLWYVMGIVSVGLGVNLDNGERTCDRYSYSLYTKVPFYMRWINEVRLQLAQNKSYPSCDVAV